MGFWGTLIGGTLGWTLGGPLGAMLGAAIGSSMSGSARTYAGPGPGPGAPPPPPPPGGRRPPPPRADAEQRRVAFFVATFGVMGHIAKADGHVSEEEAQLAREVMKGLGLDARDRNLAARIFREGKSPHFRLDDALGQLVQVAGRRRNLLRALRGDPVQGRVGGRQRSSRRAPDPRPHRFLPRLFPGRDGRRWSGWRRPGCGPGLPPRRRSSRRLTECSARTAPPAAKRSVPPTGGSCGSTTPTGSPPRDCRRK